MKKNLTLSSFFLLVLVALCAFKMASGSSTTYRKSHDQAGEKGTNPVATDRTASISDHRSIDNYRSSDSDRRHFEDALDSSLAHIFRMKTRPKWNQSSVQIPDYMRALYEVQFSDDLRTGSRPGNTGRHKRHSYPATNTIRSFTGEGKNLYTSLSRDFRPH